MNAYQIVNASDPDTLAEKVNELMGEGWVPVGGVAIDPETENRWTWYAQAMVSADHITTFFIEFVEDVRLGRAAKGK